MDQRRDDNRLVNTRLFNWIFIFKITNNWLFTFDEVAILQNRHFSFDKLT